MADLTGRMIWRHRGSIIAVVELLGASWSVVFMVWLLLGTPGPVIPWSFLILALAWFSLVGLAGVQLLRRQASGEALSIVAQVPQLLQITVGPVAFRVLAGPQLTVFFFGDRFYFFAGVTSSFNVFRSQNDPPFAIGLNLVAALFLGVLIYGTRAGADEHAA